MGDIGLLKGGYRDLLAYLPVALQVGEDGCAVDLFVHVLQHDGNDERRDEEFRQDEEDPEKHQHPGALIENRLRAATVSTGLFTGKFRALLWLYRAVLAYLPPVALSVDGLESDFGPVV